MAGSDWNHREERRQGRLARARRRLRIILPRYRSIGTLVAATCLVFLMAFVLLPSRRGSTAAGPPAPVEGPAGALPGDEAGDRPVDSRPDPALELVERIVSRKFNHRSDVAAGSFLVDFDRKAELMEQLELSRMRPLRRGVGWAQVEAPYRSWEGGEEKTAWLRFVERSGQWKLEELKLLPWRTDP